MRLNEEMFEAFRKDTDSVLEQLLPGQELKQSVLNRIHKKNQISIFYRLKIIAAVTAVCLVVSIGLLRNPIVYAQVSPTLSKLTFWIQEVTHIPVEIPFLWESPAEENDDRRYIYFEVNRSKDNYYITAYRVREAIDVNDKSALLEKNGPVSQADVLGSISGEKITDNLNETDTTFIAPADKNEFEIIPNVKAYKDSSGCTVWWEQGNWQFDYIGPSYGIENHLKRLAAEWSDISPSTAALRGRISMVEGNKFHAFITWEQDDIRYTYSVPNSNWSDVAEVINSFTESGDVTLK